MLPPVHDVLEYLTEIDHGRFSLWLQLSLLMAVLPVEIFEYTGLVIKSFFPGRENSVRTAGHAISDMSVGRH